jgi:hypothetical protein
MHEAIPPIPNALSLRGAKLKITGISLPLSLSIPVNLYFLQPKYWVIYLLDIFLPLQRNCVKIILNIHIVILRPPFVLMLFCHS